MSGNNVFDMKKITFLLMAAALAVISCDKGGQTLSDVRTYGLTGDVAEVFLSTMDPALEEEGEDPWLDRDLLMFSFDELGRVTEDDYGSQFEYDDQGNVVTKYLEVTRDAKGRIVKVAKDYLDDEGALLDEDLDVLECLEVEYTYDEKGRVVTEDYDGWEWSNVYNYEYESDAIYPSKATCKGSGEGYIDEITITYEYLSFDDKGNWTSRKVNKVVKSYEEPWEENPEPEVEITESTTREDRRITYRTK